MHAATKGPLLAVFALFLALLPSVSGGADPARKGLASLAPSLTELAWDLGVGSSLVARSSACDYPPAATNVPVAGDFGRPNLEALERLRPATILTTDVENPAALRTLRASGAECLPLSCEGWTNLMQAAVAIGRAAGRPDLAMAWTNKMGLRREALQRRVDAVWRGKTRPRVYVEIWHDPPMTVGGGTFLEDLLVLAGGSNVAHNVTPAYARVADEWLLRADPEAILLLYMTDKADGTAANLAARTGWNSLQAIRSDRVCRTIPPDLLLRPGPRCLEGAERFADWLEKALGPDNVAGPASRTDR